jgi:hypothetical protein
VSDPLRDNAYGIDVSHWQASTPSLVGLDFLFARASIGTKVDERYAQHIAKAKADGLVTGAYHFGDRRTPAAAQARTFLDTAGDVNFYVLDHEGVDRMTAVQAREFIGIVKAARGKAGLYASLSGFPSFGQSYNWIALWASEPPAALSWAFWQFGGTPLDHDVFNGSRAALRAFAGYAPQQEDQMGLQFRIIERVTGIVTVAGANHAIIRVDNGAYVPVPAGQRREVAARIALTAPAGTKPVGTTGYLVGNVAGVTPDQSIAALLIEQDGTFVADVGATAAVNLAVEHIKAAHDAEGVAIEEARIR